MKKGLLAFLLCLMMISLCACGKNTAGDAVSDGQTVETKENTDKGSADSATESEQTQEDAGEWPTMEEQLLLDCTFVKVTASNMTYDPDEGLMFDVDVENKTDDCSLRVGFGSLTLSDEHMPWEFSSDVPGESIHARIGADAERLKYLADHFGGEEGRRKKLRDLSLDIDIYLKKDGEEMRVVPYPDGDCRIVSSFSKEAAACPEVVLSEKVLLDTDELKVTLTGDTTCSTAAVMGANLLVENKTDGPIGFRAAFNRANEFSIDGGTVSLYSSVSIYNEDANLAIPAGAAKEYTALAFLKGLSEIGVHDIGSLGLHIIAETPVEDPSEEGSGKLYYVGQYFMDEECEIQTDNAGKAEETSFADGTVLYDQDGVRLVSRASADQMIIYAASDDEEHGIRIELSDIDISGGTNIGLHGVEAFPGQDFSSDGKKRVMVFDPNIVPEGGDGGECVLKARLEIRAWDHNDPLAESTVLFNDMVSIPVEIGE